MTGWLVAILVGAFLAGRFSFVWSQRAGAEPIPTLLAFGEPMSHCRLVRPVSVFDQDRAS